MAVWNHRAFYALLILLPLTGLAAVSAGRSGTTDLLGSIPLPLIPGLPDAAGDAFGGAHGVLVFVTLALVVLHVGAALKHQFVEALLSVPEDCMVGGDGLEPPTLSV